MHGRVFQSSLSEEAKLATVVVQGSEKPEQAAAKTALDKVAGATALIDNAKIEQGRDANAEDVLTLPPGIFDQSTSGTTGNKISLRQPVLGQRTRARELSEVLHL